MSCIAVITTARPSEPTRTQAYEGGPPPPYQIWLASPMPRRTGPSERARTSSRRAQCWLGAAVALEQVLRRERPAVGEVVVGVVAPPQLERVELEPRGELVEQALEPERPLDEARRAERRVRRQVELRPVGLRADVLAGVEHLASARRSGPRSRTSRSRSRTRPRARRASRRSARRRVSRWIVALRLPVARFSSRRVSAQRTGRPVFSASAIAMNV